MPVSAARAAAFDILLRVASEGSYASELLHALPHSRLADDDHGLATELTMGVLRWRSLLDSRIAARSSQRLEKLDIEVLTALRIGAYQLFFLKRVPSRAAVHESVELVKQSAKRSAAPFVNAILRRLSEEKEPLPTTVADAQPLAIELSHPLWLVERWIQRFGFDTAKSICSYDQERPPSCFYISNRSLEGELRGEGLEFSDGDIVANARRVVSGNPTNTRPFHDGRLAIQDEASQLVALLVGKGELILDCCAAPGGKTRMLSSRNPQSTILASDLHPHRARLMRKLVSASNVAVIAADVHQLPTNRMFDRVLVDVPCSGTGTLARNPEIKWRLEPDDLLDLQTRQEEILKSAMTHLAPGGLLVYSTCSLEPEENEAVVERAVNTDNSFQVVDCRLRFDQLLVEKEIVDRDFSSLLQGPYLRTIPGVHSCDGFLPHCCKNADPLANLQGYGRAASDLFTRRRAL